MHARKDASEGVAADFSFTDDHEILKGGEGVFRAEGFDAVSTDSFVRRKSFSAADDLRRAAKRIPVMLA